MESLFKLFKTISPSGYQYKDKKSTHPFWLQEGGETMDYNELDNKPSINGVTLQGNKTSGQLSMYTKAEVDASLALKADKADVYTKSEIDEMLENLPSGGGLVATTKEIDSTMFEAATFRNSVQVLATDRFVHTFTIGHKEYVAGSNLQVMANISGDLAFTYYDSVANKGYLVILSSAEVAGNISAIHCEMYKGWSYTSSLATDATVTLNDAYTFHKIKCSLNVSLLYPDGTETAIGSPIPQSYILITDNASGVVQYKMYDEGLANLRITGSGYSSDYKFSISSFAYDNKDDLTTQDRVIKVNSATITSVEEW